MIGTRVEPLAGQKRRDGLGALARQAIDDAVRPAMILEERKQLALGILLGLDGKADVRPVEAEHEALRIACKKLLHDVGAGDRVGGGG